MNAIALDTLKIAKRLRDAGFSEAQAESVTDASRDGVTGGDIATKADIDELRSEIKVMRSEIGSVRDELRSETKSVRGELGTAVARLEAKIAQSQADVLKWVFGMMVAQGAFVVTLIKLLPGK